jgi:hypothetical protein
MLHISHDVQLVLHRARDSLPIVLDGGQKPVFVRWEQLGHDGSVEETHEQRDAERDERRSDQLFSRETHVWISCSFRSIRGGPTNMAT